MCKWLAKYNKAKRVQTCDPDLLPERLMGFVRTNDRYKERQIVTDNSPAAGVDMAVETEGPADV